jgi:hypothetical protein
MASLNVMVAGEKQPSEALQSALREHDIEARCHPAHSLPTALVGIEKELSEGRFAAAVAVGTGDAALALAITASKLGVPLARLDGTDPGDRGRALATLASLEAGSDPAQAADLIASWLAEQPTPRLSA